MVAGIVLHRAVKLLDELESPVEEIVLPAFDPVVTMAAIAEHQVADVLLAPTMIEMIVDHPEVGAYDLSCLTEPHLRCVTDLRGPAIAGRKVFSSAAFTQAYGMTELSPAATSRHSARSSCRREPAVRFGPRFIPDGRRGRRNQRIADRLGRCVRCMRRGRDRCDR